MQYQQWLCTWLDIYVAPQVKERTWKKYQTQVRLHIMPALGEVELEGLSAIELQRFVSSLTKKGLASNTGNGVISVLKTSLKCARRIGLVQSEYSDGIQRPKLCERQTECFSRTEQRKIETYVAKKQKPHYFGVVLCLYTGIRIGELLALQWSDIDFKKRVLTISKSCHDDWKNGKYCKAIDTPKTQSSVRKIPLPKQIADELKSMRGAKNGYVIGGERVHGIPVRTYQKAFCSILKGAAVPQKRFHSLRHTFATRALECGMDVKTLSELLGHKNASVTLKRYAHSMCKHKKEMMNKLCKSLHPL